VSPDAVLVALGILAVVTLLLAYGLWQLATHVAGLELRLDAGEQGRTNMLALATEALDIAKAACDKADALDRELHPDP
jgi:hypothetical protein